MWRHCCCLPVSRYCWNREWEKATADNNALRGWIEGEERKLRFVAAEAMAGVQHWSWPWKHARGSDTSDTNGETDTEQNEKSRSIDCGWHNNQPIEEYTNLNFSDQRPKDRHRHHERGYWCLPTNGQRNTSISDLDKEDTKDLSDEGFKNNTYKKLLINTQKQI